MDTKLLHVRNKLEFIIRFMMAGDGSFKARLSEAYRHPQYGLRQVPLLFMPPALQQQFSNLLQQIDSNERSKVLNEKKMELMDEIFFFYKSVCDVIMQEMLKDEGKDAANQPTLIEQSDIPTSEPAIPKKKSKSRKKKVTKG